MPKMSGRDLVAALATAHPAIKGFFSPGNINEWIIHQGTLEAGLAFFQKPFTPATILGNIRDILDSSSAQASAC